MVELAAAIASALGVWLMAKRLRWGWPVGLMSVLIYGWVFIDAQLYSDALLQGCFGVMIVYGWINWSFHLDQHKQVTVQPLTRKAALFHLALGALGALALGTFMHHLTNADLPRLDAALAAFSLVGQWWQARRHAAAWIMWIVVDLVYIGMYIHKALWITAVLYTGFIGLAIYGWISWLQAQKKTPSGVL